MSLLSEMKVFDRPEVKTKLKFGNQSLEVILRNPSAFETDNIEAFEANEYGRLLVEYTQATDGKMSERERLTAHWSSRNKADVIDRLLPVRSLERDQIAFTLMGYDSGEESLKMSEMGEQELIDYAAQKDKELLEHRNTADKQLRDEMDSESAETLVNRLVEVIINVGAQRKARAATNANYIYYTVHYPDHSGKKAFDSAEAVKQELTAETIERVSEDIRKALIPEPEAPFVKAADQEPAKRGSSRSKSGRATKDSGDSTKGTQSD